MHINKTIKMYICKHGHIYTYIYRICLPTQEARGWSLGWEDPLEKEMVTNSSILAWKTEEPDRLLFMGLQRVGQDLAVHSYFFHMSARGICGQRCHLILLYIYISLKKIRTHWFCNQCLPNKAIYTWRNRGWKGMLCTGFSEVTHQPVNYHREWRNQPIPQVSVLLVLNSLYFLHLLDYLFSLMALNTSKW